MPVFGVPESSYVGGGVAPGRHGTVDPGGTPVLTWPSRAIETAFVLGGGGNKGALQVGMLRALTERSIAPDLLVGTSIGAINAAAFAGAPSIEGVYLAAELWRRIAANDVFPRTRFHGAWRYVERREAVFPNEGLRKLIASCLRFESLEDSPIPLVVVASRLDDGVEEWLDEGPAVEAVMASAALPGLYPPIESRGSHYVDGGVLDNVPLAAAMAARPRRVFVLLCSSVQLETPRHSRPYEALFAAYRLNVHGRLRRDLAAVPAGVDVVVFEEPSVERFDPADFSRTDELIERGYLSARDVLDDYLAAVTARSEAAQRRSWPGAPRRPRRER